MTHFSEEATCVAIHKGWKVCPHLVVMKLHVYQSPHNGHALRSNDLFIGAMGLKNNGMDEDLPSTIIHLLHLVVDAYYHFF